MAQPSFQLFVLRLKPSQDIDAYTVAVKNGILAFLTQRGLGNSKDCINLEGLEFYPPLGVIAVSCTQAAGEALRQHPDVAEVGGQDLIEKIMQEQGGEPNPEL